MSSISVVVATVTPVVNDAAPNLSPDFLVQVAVSFLVLRLFLHSTLAAVLLSPVVVS